MKTLRCKCGQTFQVEPQFYGKIISTPCCNSRVRVPGENKVQAPAEPAHIQVRCSCGKAMAVARPKGPVTVQCPACQTRIRVGGNAPATVLQPATRVEDDVFASLPSLGPATWPPAAAGPGMSPPTAPMAQRRSAPSPAKRLPRIGVLEDGFGSVLLINAGFVLLGILSALGVYLSTQASENMSLAAASESWQPADGKILDSGYTTRSGSRGRQSATVSVRYEYKVKDATYTGSTLSFEKQDSYTPSIAEAVLRPYPPGATCTVYYNPDSPSQSVLIKGAQSSNTFNFWLGLAFILCGVVLAIDCWIGAVNAFRFPPPKLPLF